MAAGAAAPSSWPADHSARVSAWGAEQGHAAAAPEPGGFSRLLLERWAILQNILADALAVGTLAIIVTYLYWDVRTIWQRLAWEHRLAAVRSRAAAGQARTAADPVDDADGPS